MSKIDDIRARWQAVVNRETWARDVMRKYADRDIPYLLSEIERLTAELQAYKQQEKRPEPCDDYYDGLKVKYRVYKARNNEPVEGCFVLRPDKDPAAVEALRAYADATGNTHLASDILAWVGQPEPLNLEQLREMDQQRVWVQFPLIGMYGIVSYLNR